MSTIELPPRVPVDDQAIAPSPPAVQPRPGGGRGTRPPDPSSVSRRVRRNRRIWALGLLAALLGILFLATRGSAGHSSSPTHHTASHHSGVPESNPRLNPSWEGDGKAVTFAFGGDVHFPPGTNLGDRLAAEPSTALGPTVPELLGGADLKMVNFESALTDGTCPDPGPKQYVFYAPTTAIQAFQGAGVTLVTEANNHGEDCGPPGLQMALAAKAKSGYPVIGIGQNSEQAFTPYTTEIDGQRISIIAATQVIDTDLQTLWTATPTQPGLASAYAVGKLVNAVEKARKVSDTVIVYLHWGTELDACPNPLQEPLANLLVRAGADIIVGTHAHVLLGAGFLGSAYVDYGLGNFAFYDNNYPENQSGSLIITATGRHINDVTWRPAEIVNDLPQPLTGAAASTELANWAAARSCTDVTATAGAPLATPKTEQTKPTAAQYAQLGQNS